MNPKLKSSVSVVKLSDNVLEFFKTNTREQIRLKVNADKIIDITKSMNGEYSILEIAKNYDIDYTSLVNLVDYLNEKGVMEHINPTDDFYKYDSYRRIINFLSDYSKSHTQLTEFWGNILNKTVVIIGLGAVGTWVSANLVQSGITKIIIVDSDTVELSNLHRQFGYTEEMIGQKKIYALEKHLKQYNPDLEIEKIDCFLDENTLARLDDKKIDLIINCADKPNVDTTSLWVGEYCMRRNIPHIVGGGYNLHLSLIGQTVIPAKSACVKCFEKQLEEDNKIDTTRVKKLQVQNRKVGSFGPMCSLIASQIGMEAIKIISECTIPANINRRGEFDIFTMDISYKTFNKREDCEWCGKNGKYSH